MSVRYCPLATPEKPLVDPSEAAGRRPGKIRDRRLAGEAARLGALARILVRLCGSKPGGSESVQHS